MLQVEMWYFEDYFGCNQTYLKQKWLNIDLSWRSRLKKIVIW